MKKQVLFMCLALFFARLTAQNTTQELEISIDSMLINIDKTTFTSGILYDRVTALANLKNFNQQTNTSNLKHFEQALNELYKASNKEKFIDYKRLRKKKKEYNVVDIGIINTTFHTLNYNFEDKTNAALKLNKGLFEQIEDRDPFAKHNALLIAPLKDYAMGNTIDFSFNNDFIFQTNNTKKIVSLTAYFGTNTSYKIIENSKILQNTVSITYSKSGYKTLMFTVVFNDGTSKVTKGKLHVKIPKTALQRTNDDPLVEDFTITSTIPFQGYDESAPIFGEIEYRVFYHTNNGNTQRTLVKPILIIDGFDPLDQRKISDDDSPKPPDQHNSIEEMMEYTVDGAPFPTEIIPLLRELGYDVVIVNHPVYTRGTKTIDGGADYIERNAMNHVTLYQHLNNEVFSNGSNQQLVLVGPSMGGQISRYALAYMEKNNIPHNTRLWVSVDSPHLGANIPIGVQSLINVLYENTDSVGAEDFVTNWLGSTAAKQQLIEQYNGTELVTILFGIVIPGNNLKNDYLDGKTTSQGFSETRGHPFYEQFYNNMLTNGLGNSKGFPENTRRIAIVNGSLTGSKKFNNPFQSLSTQLSGTIVEDLYPVGGSKTLKIEGDANIIGHIVTMETYFMPSTNDYHKLAYFKTKKILGWNYYHRYGTNNNSRGSLDNVPGGWFPTQRDLAHSILGESPSQPIFGDITNWSITVNDWDVNRLNHIGSFIPTVSSLGFINPDFDWNQKLDRNLVCSNEIPFDSYFGPDINERHTSFTEESVNWLLEELAGNPQEPYFPISSSSLVGQTSVCDRQVATYTFNPCKIPGSVSNWQVSSNLQIVSSNGTSITVKPPSDSRSSGWIKADFANGKSVTKNIWVGRPDTPASLFGPTTVNTGALVTYTAGFAVGATSYKWYLPYPYTTVSTFDYFGLNWQLQAPGNTTTARTFTGYAQNAGYVQVMGQNDCGTGGAKLLYVQHQSSGGGGAIPRANPNDDVKEISLYPNPAKNKVTVRLTRLTKYIGEPPTVIYSIKILDLNLIERRFYKFKKPKNQETINLAFLSTGLYTLIIYTDNGTFTKKLLIK
jgi:hypothetical protein